MIGASAISSKYFLHFATASLLLGGHLRAQDPQEFFENRVRPLLVTHCQTCHGPKQQMGGLNLSTAEGFYNGTSSGPVIVKGDPEKSQLIQAVSYRGKIKMPPTGKLSEQEISDLTAWVKMGAMWPKTEAPPTRRQTELWS